MDYSYADHLATLEMIKAELGKSQISWTGIEGPYLSKFWTVGKSEMGSFFINSN